MEWSLAKKCLWVSLVLLLGIHHGCFGCLEEERIALLEIKTFLNWRDAEDGSWVDGRGSDCCAWERVKCNVTTGRVIQLSLESIRGIGNENGDYLNVTLFSAFQELQHLNLSNNLFYGWIENEGFERLVGLKKLEVLDLSQNLFNTSILPSLGAVTSLRTLSLAKNLNSESLSHYWEELANLHNLQSLDLSQNSMEASLQIIQGLKKLGGLQKLEVLDLNGNYLNNSILPYLGAITSLRKLSLSGNSFDGPSYFEELFTMYKLQSLDLSFNSLNTSSRNIQGLCQLKSLHELYLSWNNFEGILPPCLKNLTSLRMLDLSYNRFTGDTLSSLIPNLTSLISISLSYNNFDGLFPFVSFANNSNLESIDLRRAGNRLKVETNYPSWVPPFQLKELLLSNNNLNNTIPTFLSNQHNLRQVDLSSNNLKGLFPTWLLENNKMLRVLILRNNSLSGHFVLPSKIHEAAHIIDISNNHIDGLLQTNIGKMLPNLVYLNLSQNYFQGNISSSIGDLKMLLILDLSNNKFSGEIPTQMAKGCNNLVILRLSNNSLHGQILPPYFNLTQLVSLHVETNLFSGNILTGLSKCSGLQILDIGNNQITGRIPNWIGNFTYLNTLIMRDNFLQGDVPVEFSKLTELNFLDLSHNSLLGSMPSILNSTSLEYLHLEGNRFTRTPPIAHFNGSSLLTLDIRDNDFYGVIPEWIGSLFYLRVLLLKQNHFSGPIPNYFCELELINIMDLSHNALSGPIPQCLNNISFGSKGSIGPEFVQMTIPMYNFVYSPSFADLFLLYDDYNGFRFGESEEVEFIMRSRSNSYKGEILNIVFELDLSCNNLRNDIPFEIGDLNRILALNLSHNQLTGPIPGTLSNLTQIESLDLSYNKLSGKIPSELSILYSLEVFSVAYNNLSGKTPDMNNGQFSTFDSTSYEGNLFLCGPPLPRGCSSVTKSTNTSATPSVGVKGDDDIDITAFFASFAASYVMTLFGFAAVLYINPYWQRMWFRFIEHCIDSCHEFLSDIWYKLVIRACT